MGRAIIVAMVTLVLTAPAPSILGDELTSQQVRESIEKGIGFLRLKQQADGGWGEWISPQGGNSAPGGLNGLCTLALLNAGVAPSDPTIQKALDRIRRSIQRDPSRNTYAVSLQTMALCRAEPQRDAVQIGQNVKWLESTQIDNGPTKGSWGYPSSFGDNSNSQFALLALYEADQLKNRRGEKLVPVADRTWRLAKAYWESCQNVDGSWPYQRSHMSTSTGSMTCAGIAAMVITDDRTNPPDAMVTGDQIECCGRGESENQHIVRGLQWLGANFTVNGNPGYPRQTFMYYYLYGLERVGRMTARRFIGGHDWYREGADVLVRNQDGLSGFWKGVGYAEEEPTIGTSLALLFLSKGRWPVLLGKLKYGSGDDWNQHRSDVNNLTRYVESRWKLDLTWQIVDLKKATVEDLRQSPVLYLCGSESPLPADEEQQRASATKLRDYVDRGGFLFAEAYCGGTGFDTGFRALMAQTFPEPEYRLHLLPPEHPIWFAEQDVKPDQIRPLLGIDYGCRTSIVYAPRDFKDPRRPSLSCLWELSRSGRGQKYSETVENQIAAGLAIGANVLAYATNRELRDKPLGELRPIAAGAADTVERGKFYIAKLRHPGGCNSAPRALTNLLESAAGELKLRVNAEQRLIDIGDEAIFNYPLVYMQGRSSFHLTEGEHKRLREYVQRGGMVFADSICASPAFTDSFRREMAAIFPGQPLKAIPGNDPLWTPRYGGFDLHVVTRRDPQARQPKEPLKAAERRLPPQLEAVSVGKRYGVIFSPFDLSCALEKQDSLECQGYVREDAARIGLNVILYALTE